MRACFLFCAFFLLFTVTLPELGTADTSLPDGLFSRDPMVRQIAAEDAGEKKLVEAEHRLAELAQKDSYANVREAACEALSDIWATGRIPLLKDIAQTDPNAAVRDAATRSIAILEGRPSTPPSTDGPMDGFPADTASPQRDAYKKPELIIQVAQSTERQKNFGIGIGSMGGFGIAALSLRGTIPTGSSVLPWVGIELGGGWTPPAFYQLMVGPIGEITHKDNKWWIFSGAASVLLYFHRMHYIPLRAGFDPGRGVYGILGYGFEYLNEEGFFSWGVEAGITYQPMIHKRIDNLVDCSSGDQCSKSELWPIIPFIRFSLHFYLA